MRASLQSVVFACTLSLQQPAELGAYRRVVDATS